MTRVSDMMGLSGPHHAADGTRASIDACDGMGEGLCFGGLDEMTELFIIFYFESSPNPEKKLGELTRAGAN